MLTVEGFKTDPGGYGNWYVWYALIGKGLGIQDVVDALNKIIENIDDKYVMDAQIEHRENDYNMVSFTIGKGNTDYIYDLTAELNCIGYAETPWCDDISLFCVKNGKDYNEGFTAEWSEDMPYDREEDDEDGNKCWDCFVDIIDETSGFVFESGQGAVNSETMEIIENFIDEHCA